MRDLLLFIVCGWSALTLAAPQKAGVIIAQPLVNPEVLEPSVLNEVEHALRVAPTNAAPCDYVVTNGTTATARAIDLVSTQKSDGRWYVGTNDVTSAVLHELRRLSGLEKELQ